MSNLQFLAYLYVVVSSAENFKTLALESKKMKFLCVFQLIDEGYI